MMGETVVVLDHEALYLALDRQRRMHRLSWRRVAEESGIGVINIGTRLGQGHSLSVETLIRLMLWLGVTDLGPFMRVGRGR